MLDYILTGITLAVAVIGTILKDPGRWGKIALISLAVVASIGSIVKSHEDDKQKDFIQTALISTLSPSASDYRKIHSEVESVLKEKGAPQDTVSFLHNGQGMISYVTNKDNQIYSVTVFNRTDLATIYANVLQKKANKTLISELFEHNYNVQDPDDDLFDRIGILAFSVYRRRYSVEPDSYIYDTDHGLTLYYRQGVDNKSVTVTDDEIIRYKDMPAHNLFISLAADIDSKIIANEAVAQQPPSPTPLDQKSQKN